MEIKGKEGHTMASKPMLYVRALCTDDEHNYPAIIRMRSEHLADDLLESIKTAIADKIEKEIKRTLSSAQNRIDLNVIVGLPEELEKSVTDETFIKIDEMFIGIKRI